jgi:hypothetical protein
MAVAELSKTVLILKREGPSRKQKNSFSASEPPHYGLIRIVPALLTAA